MEEENRMERDIEMIEEEKQEYLESNSEESFEDDDEEEMEEKDVEVEEIEFSLTDEGIDEWIYELVKLKREKTSIVLSIDDGNDLNIEYDDGVDDEDEEEDEDDE
jgi:hypothetical protein